MSELTVAALIRKRDQLSLHIEALQRQTRQALIDMDHLEATIRLFDLDIDLGPLRSRLVPPPHQQFARETTKVALTLLRETSEPITTEMVAHKLMEERGLSLDDLRMRHVLIKRAGACLGGMKRKGVIKEVGERTAKSGERSFKRWVLAGC